MMASVSLPRTASPPPHHPPCARSISALWPGLALGRQFLRLGKAINLVSCGWCASRVEAALYPIASGISRGETGEDSQHRQASVHFGLRLCLGAQEMGHLRKRLGDHGAAEELFAAAEDLDRKQRRRAGQQAYAPVRQNKRRYQRRLHWLNKTKAKQAARAERAAKRGGGGGS